MHRPCLLVLDTEHANSLSSRKLVLETAKLNVITAYSCREASLELERFPAVNALVLNGLITHDADFPELARCFELHPNVRIVVVGDCVGSQPDFRIDAQVESFSPARLLAAIQQMFPAETQLLLEHDRQLEAQ